MRNGIEEAAVGEKHEPSTTKNLPNTAAKVRFTIDNTT
jgi:hypothetical protein